MESRQPMITEARTLSVVVAAFNEEGNLPILYDRLRALDWKALGLEPEFLFVDDHSRDRTPEILAAFAAGDPRVKVLRFSRNFGSHKAFTAGLEHCAGDGAVILAADLQGPAGKRSPSLWRNGARAPASSGRSATAATAESAATKLLSRLYYGLMRRFAEVQPPKKERISSSC